MKKNKKTLNREIYDKYIGNYVFNGDDPRDEWDGNEGDTKYANHDKTNYENAVTRDYKKKDE